VVLVLELAEGYSVRTILFSKMKNIMKEEEAANIIYQITSAIGYCHSSGITHRDLKLENVIVDKNHRVKIIDFGLSAYSKGNRKLTFFCGTPSFLSPEIIKSSNYIGPPVDIWSIGVMLYVMVVGSFPFVASTQKELFETIARGNIIYPEHLSSEVASLLKLIFNMDPEARINADEILKHEFFIKNKITDPSKNEEEAIEYDEASFNKLVF